VLNFIAVDMTTGKVLARTRREANADWSQLSLPELDRTFKSMPGKPPRGGAITLTAEKQAVAWLYRYWNKWVSKPWKRSRRIMLEIEDDTRSSTVEIPGDL